MSPARTEENKQVSAKSEAASSPWTHPQKIVLVVLVGLGLLGASWPLYSHFLLQSLAEGPSGVTQIAPLLQFFATGVMLAAIFGYAAGRWLRKD